MIPGNALIVACPHCGGRKALMSLLSGNTFGATYWSDSKMEAPMLPRISLVQRCPACGRYSFASDMQEVGYAKERFAGGLGRLPYRLLKEAAAELLPTENADKELAIRIELLWAYNELYAIENRNTPSDEERQYMFDNRVGLMKLAANKGNRLLCAELCRELSAFDDCIELLGEHKFGDDYEKQIAAMILEKARHEDDAVFGWIWADVGKLKEIKREKIQGNGADSTFRSPEMGNENEQPYTGECTKQQDDNQFIVSDDDLPF